MRHVGALLVALAMSGCAAWGRQASRIEFPPLPLENAEFVVSVDASVECDSAMHWRAMRRGWTTENLRESDLSILRTKFDRDVIGPGDFTSFLLRGDRLPVLVVENADDADCRLWAVEAEVGPVGWMPGSTENDVLMMDYASHGLWHREKTVWIE